jgi:hypothetical protein
MADEPTYTGQKPYHPSTWLVRCNTCGAHVLDQSTHTAWHAEQEQDLGEVGLSILNLQGEVRKLIMAARSLGPDA